MLHETIFNFWGLLIALCGLCLFLCGFKKSQNVIYRLVVARSKILWGEKVHGFHQVAGILMMLFGILVAIGKI
jgi:hypothetical protein